MTIVSTAPQALSAVSLAAELDQSRSDNVDFMIGIALEKNSEAVYFQYTGDKTYAAVMQANGKPVTNIGPVVVTGVGIATDIGEYNADKLNIFLKTMKGNTLMITSGLTTMWSQCILTGLMGMFAENSMNSLIDISTYKGTNKYKTCMASIYNNKRKVSSDSMFNDFLDARRAKDDERKTQLAKQAVDVLSAALTEANQVDEVVVEEVTELQADY